MPQRKTKKLGLVHTGGTIASVRGAEGINLANHEEGNQTITKILDDCELIVRTPCHILSENARPEHWRLIASAALELVAAGVDGIVITHGTDTLAYTAAALCFVLHPTPVPVIITGSMLPADDPEADGPDNLRWSARIALHPSAPCEVAILFGGGSVAVAAYYVGSDQFYAGFACADHLDKVLIRGTRVKKVAAWPTYFAPPARRYAAFQSVQADLLGAVFDDQHVVFGPATGTRPYTPRVTRRHLAQYHARNQFDSRVAVLRAHPGFDAHILCYLVTELGYRGMIIEGYGDGGLPTDDGGSGAALVSAVQQITAAGAIVCVTSSVLGPASLRLYIGGKSLIDAGAVPLQDMTTECAVVKLMWSLACSQAPTVVRTMMTQDLANDIHIPA